VEPTIGTVAVVGSGVIGRSWARVFVRAGCRVRLYDALPGQTKRALDWLDETLASERAFGFIGDEGVRAQRALVSAHDDLAEALRGVGYVQESTSERLPIKQAVYAELDRLASPDIILASSTSALDMTQIAAGLPASHRCVVAHPVNPPHVIPAVEIVPGATTSAETVERAAAFQRSVGQTPVVMRFYRDGFLLNRMQMALFREAIALVESGVADLEAVEAVIRDGLGLRWALMGQFATANTNADGGLRQYFERYGESIRRIMDDLGPTPPLDAAQIDRLAAATDELTGDVPLELWQRWRDRQVQRISALKRTDSPAGSVG